MIDILIIIRYNRYMKKIYTYGGITTVLVLAISVVAFTQMRTPVTAQFSTIHKPSVKVQTQETTTPPAETPTVAPTQATTAVVATAPTPPVAKSPQPRVYLSADSGQYPAGSVRLPMFTTDGTYNLVTTSSCPEIRFILTYGPGSSWMTGGADMTGPQVGKTGMVTVSAIGDTWPMGCTWSVQATSAS